MPDLAEVFEWLDDLRESGKINMFGAAPYLAERFAIEKDAARKMLRQWMDSFDGEKTAGERASQFAD